jgi:hypothetical protein
MSLCCSPGIAKVRVVHVESAAETELVSVRGNIHHPAGVPIPPTAEHIQYEWLVVTIGWWLQMVGGYKWLVVAGDLWMRLNGS